MNDKTAKQTRRKMAQYQRRQEAFVAMEVKRMVNACGLGNRLYIATLILFGRW